MFCPKCGEGLQINNREMRCESGDKGLSSMLQEILRARFEDLPPLRSSEPPISQKLHGGFRDDCPGVR